ALLHPPKRERALTPTAKYCEIYGTCGIALHHGGPTRVCIHQGKRARLAGELFDDQIQLSIRGTANARNLAAQHLRFPPHLQHRMISSSLHRILAFTQKQDGLPWFDNRRSMASGE